MTALLERSARFLRFERIIGQFRSVQRTWQRGHDLHVDNFQISESIAVSLVVAEVDSWVDVGSKEDK